MPDSLSEATKAALKAYERLKQHEIALAEAEREHSRLASAIPELEMHEYVRATKEIDRRYDEQLLGPKPL